MGHAYSCEVDSSGEITGEKPRGSRRKTDEHATSLAVAGREGLRPCRRGGSPAALREREAHVYWSDGASGAVDLMPSCTPADGRELRSTGCGLSVLKRPILLESRHGHPAQASSRSEPPPTPSSLEAGGLAMTSEAVPYSSAKHSRGASSHGSRLSYRPAACAAGTPFMSPPLTLRSLRARGAP